METAAEDLLKQLESQSKTKRLEAARALGDVDQSNPSIVRGLERAALTDADAAVREQVLQALSKEAHRAIQRGLTALAPRDRATLLTEIEKLHLEGVLPAELAQILRGRYTAAPPRAARAKPAISRARPTSLASVLLSEASVRIALFLGAFFVIAAAFVLAAVVEAARLPILGVMTILFFGAAAALYRHLRLASFVLFIVATLMVPIDAGVLFDLREIPMDALARTWSLVAVIAGALWIGGTYLYRSRLLSLLALIAFDVAIALGGSGFEVAWPAVMLGLGVVGALAVAASVWMRGWQGPGHFWPLFTASHFQLLALLAGSSVALIITAALEDPPQGAQWLSLAGLWLVSVVVFWASNALISDTKARLGRVFRLLAVAAAIPVPLLALGAIQPEFPQLMAVAWAWGLALAALGDASASRRLGNLSLASAPLLWAGVLLFAFAAFGSWTESEAITVAYFFMTCAVLVVLTVARLRLGTWLAALVAAYFGYLSAFDLTALSSIGVPASYLHLFGALALIAAERVIRARSRVRSAWWHALFILALSAGVVDALVALYEGSDEPLRGAVVMGTFAGVWLLYALLEKRPRLGFAATGMAAFALTYLLRHNQVQSWVQPFVGLAGAYYMGGRALKLRRRGTGWHEVLRWSGLALGAVTSLAAPAQGDLPALLGVAIVAMLFTLEAFLEKNVWLGIPANLLYFEAYVMVLAELEVSEPQFYSIAAALLGIIMHYLFLRSRHQTSAFAAGIVAQLILLSTSYIQMVTSEELVFFFVLFFQSLVLLAYGLVIRSRSFVILPVIFSVVGVLSVAFSVLSGLPTALIIGCTGLLLLGLGISALLLRERLREATERLGERWGPWSA